MKREIAEYQKIATIKELAEYCEGADFKLILPGIGDLLIDLDNPDLKSFNKEVFEMIPNCLGQVYASCCWRSKHGNWHISIKTEIDLTDTQRSLLQLALGSDHKREILAMRQILQEKGVPSCLFQPNGSKILPLRKTLARAEAGKEV